MTRDGEDAVLVRWATRWDREQVIGLVAALAADHGTEVEPSALEEAFERALRCPDEVRFCVAERDGQVLGVASLHRGYSTWRAMEVGVVQDLFVAPQARRSGVGTAIMEFLREQGIRRGYCRLELQVQADNEGARRLYEALGMENTGYLVYTLELVKTEGDAG